VSQLFVLLRLATQKLHDQRKRDRPLAKQRSTQVVITQCYTVLDLLMGLLSTTSFTHVMHRLLTQHVAVPASAAAVSAKSAKHVRAAGVDVDHAISARFEESQLTRKALEVLSDRLLVLRKTQAEFKTDQPPKPLRLSALRSSDAMDVDTPQGDDTVDGDESKLSEQQRRSQKRRLTRGVDDVVVLLELLPPLTGQC